MKRKLLTIALISFTIAACGKLDTTPGAENSNIVANKATKKQGDPGTRILASQLESMTASDVAMLEFIKKHDGQDLLVATERDIQDFRQQNETIPILDRVRYWDFGGRGQGTSYILIQAKSEQKWAKLSE